jgi:hypothetical protein
LHACWLASRHDGLLAIWQVGQSSAWPDDMLPGLLASLLAGQSVGCQAYMLAVQQACFVGFSK